MRPGAIRASQRAYSASLSFSERRFLDLDCTSPEEFIARARSIVEALPDVVWSVSASRKLLYVSPAFREVFGREREEIRTHGILWGALAVEEDQARVLTAWQEALQRGALEVEYRIRTPDGDTRWVHSRGRVVRDAQGNAVRVDGVSRDITDRKSQGKRIAELRRISALLGGINTTLIRARSRAELFEEACRIAVREGGFGIAGIAVLDRAAGRLRTVSHYGLGAPLDYDLPEAGSTAYAHNTALRALLERQPAYVHDITAAEPSNELRRTALAAGLRSVLSLPILVDDAVDGVMFMYAREPHFFRREEVELWSEFARGVGAALHHIDRDERLRYLAQYDVLTGLPNRAFFHERLASMLDRSKDAGGQIAVAIANITRFRSLNETFGRAAADALLRELAQRLRVAWPEAGCVGRMSGDTFALMLRAPADAASISAALERNLRGVCAQAFVVNGREVRIAVTAGVAVAPADGDDAETLTGNAEAAQRGARASGDMVLFYRREMNAQVAQSLLLENRLRRAIEREEFELHYQPKRAALGGRITGLEALIRWQDPESGLVPPGTFIPVLEESGLILPVGSWAMRRALEDSQAWASADGRPLRVAVNVSPIQLRQRDFVDVVRAAGEGLPGGVSRLDLEITESTIMENLDCNVPKLAAVREMGVNIAVDDFGTGYSSLGYLAKLPVNALKIDRSFVATMTNNPHSMTLVSTIISLAHALDLKVIAEGVESHEQAKLLRLLKCDELQGFLLSAAVRVEAVPDIVNS